jgi:hypothetical protein
MWIGLKRMGRTMESSTSWSSGNGLSMVDRHGRRPAGGTAGASEGAPTAHAKQAGAIGTLMRGKVNQHTLARAGRDVQRLDERMRQRLSQVSWR